MRILFYLFICEILSIVIFSIGFFPQKVVLEGTGDFQYDKSLQAKITPVFDKLVFIVIDALRSDFLYYKNQSNFQFVHELLNTGDAWGFTAYSNPPTVTLPRLKGITTGSTPNFLDAILNVAEDYDSSNLKDQDSWLSQFYYNNKKIRFFGDDTWLKLFPSYFFQESEGVSSFFVSDFEQVDNNVTRHIYKQLDEKAQWDVLILHYLGLDHIGHKGGALSPFMHDKHKEMDDVIKQIYNKVTDNTLIVVMGDHGMNDLGNHGGSSDSETSSALTFISKKLRKFNKPINQKYVKLPLDKKMENYQYLTSIKQIDLVPTLSALFNLPIPKNNLGIIIHEFTQMFNKKVKNIKILDNYMQLMKLTGEIHESKLPSFTIDELSEKMRNIQNTLTTSATNYNYTMIAIGLGLLIFVCIVVTQILFSTLDTINMLLITMITLIIGLSTIGSSFVEEEHQLWWWFCIGFCMLDIAKTPSNCLQYLTIGIGLRFIRAWNNSGQKNFYNNTIFELLKVHTNYQWILNILTIIINGSQINIPGSFILSGLCIIYKSCWAIVNDEHIPLLLKVFTDNILLISRCKEYQLLLVPVARLFFIICLLAIILQVIIAKMKDNVNIMNNIISIIVMILIFQTTSPNIPLFLVFFVLQKQILKLVDHTNIYLIIIMSLVLQNLTFFQMGGTNSISTINLSNAYNGVSENYNIYVVGLLMCLSNFSSSIYWHIIFLPAIYQDKKKVLSTFTLTKIPILFYYSVVGFLLMTTCIIQRHHLFIWSVFSPKICYYLAWNFVMHLSTNYILELFLLLIVSSKR